MKITPLVFALTLCYQSNGQSLKPNLQNRDLWYLTGRSVENIMDNSKKGVKLGEGTGAGLYILKNYEFDQGVIEFDIRGRNVLQQSFVGLAFHIQNDTTYDAVYFRPFNFKNEDSLRRWRAVQYISTPDYDWPKLRAEYPGKYESKVNPVPDPDDWFHAKIMIEGKAIRVFVNNLAIPCLEVQKLVNTSTGNLGVWVGNGSDGSFANLTITPLKKR